MLIDDKDISLNFMELYLNKGMYLFVTILYIIFTFFILLELLIK